MTEKDEQNDDRCFPCRGTGKLISKLGGEENQVTCPWCNGTGKRPPKEEKKPEDENVQ